VSVSTIESSTVAEEGHLHWALAKETHGSAFDVPQYERNRIALIQQGMYVIMANDGKAPVFKTMRAFGIPEDICLYLISKYCGEVDGADDVSLVSNSRKDKYQAFEEWSRSHIGEQFSTQTLAEESGFSYPTILKFLKESPLFKRVKNGWWEPVVVETRH